MKKWRIKLTNTNFDFDFKRERRKICLLDEELIKIELFCLFRALMARAAKRDSIVGWKRTGVGTLCHSCCIFRLISASNETNMEQMEG